MEEPRGNQECSPTTRGRHQSWRRPPGKELNVEAAPFIPQTHREVCGENVKNVKKGEFSAPAWTAGPSSKDEYSGPFLHVCMKTMCCEDIEYQRDLPNQLQYPIEEPFVEFQNTVIVLKCGIIRLSLRRGLYILLTADKGVMIVNTLHNSCMFTDSGNENGGIISNQLCFCFMKKYYFILGKRGGGKFYKCGMCEDGCLIASSESAVYYECGSSVQTNFNNNDVFALLSTDFGKRIFYNNSRAGTSVIAECNKIVKMLSIKTNEEGTNTWTTQNFAVEQGATGDVMIQTGNIVMCVSPSTGEMSLSNNSFKMETYGHLHYNIFQAGLVGTVLNSTSALTGYQNSYFGFKGNQCLFI